MAIVVDTGPLIKGSNLRKLGEEFYTIPQVLQEVRDKNTRSSLGLKLEELKVTLPTEEDVEFVQEFARKTGDIRSLSSTDIGVIALACKLHRENGGQLAQNPGEILTNQNKASDWNEWITPENFTQRVGMMSLDFAMQNVAKQLGLRVLSAGGLEIRHVKRWVQKCRACFEICEDVEKEFCPWCGNHTLYKISYSVNPKGEKVFHEPKKKKSNLQGTVYPIPLPKGGKQHDDVILREDQLYLMGGRQHKWNWTKPEAFDPDSLEAFDYKLKPKCPYKFGHKRRNPNEPVKKKR